MLTEYDNLHPETLERAANTMFSETLKIRALFYELLEQRLAAERLK